ncbi:hypothetical protein MKW94_023253 [Papaver nudicaule]|uniref:HECT-type E3 ubiquitin transferase n=1 Tax=Papaver nudicaule TaxID=74823 RepID=A0AA41V650_PAPNU|nr:hypothetical protein [Papaver nudicaule]
MNMWLSYNNASAFRHNQIFVSAGAAAALVMLFVSPITGNKECAEEAIRLFLRRLALDVVTKESHAHSVCIILEFCKFLCRETSQENPLYLGCKVIKGLDSCVKSRRIAAKSLVGDVRDFIAFLIPLCNVIENVLGKMGLPICLTDLLPCYVVELGSLHVIFLGMLGKIDECLKKLEISVGKNRAKKYSLRSEWGQYLVILKALDSLSKLYKGGEENVLSVLRLRQVALNVLILNSRRSDDNSWILKHKDLTCFESRSHLTMMLLPELNGEYEYLFEMLIDREQVLAESFEYISEADVEDLLDGRLFVEFKNEEATGPGVLREWFCSVCQAICNPHNALFVACPDDNRRFFTNPVSDVNPLHLEYFQFFGRVIALSLVYKVQTGILFDRTFFLQLAGATVSLEDVRDADPIFYLSCKKILEMDTELLDSDALGLTFARDIERLGSRTTVELCPGGNNIALNSKNREAYHEDLDKMLHGNDKAICVKDWKAHTEYNGCKKTDSQIIWFWKVHILSQIKEFYILPGCNWYCCFVLLWKITYLCFGLIRLSKTQ